MRPVKRAKENWWNKNPIDEYKISEPSKDKPLYYDLQEGETANFFQIINLSFKIL